MSLALRLDELNWQGEAPLTTGVGLGLVTWGGRGPNTPWILSKGVDPVPTLPSAGIKSSYRIVAPRIVSAKPHLHRGHSGTLLGR